ncbi:MAG: peptidoglycan DD-metalloendopeptidase family protein [Clostridia bacterium]|nr:peptidoglycan DD-metalloendopeptidase family protein [Clostridia bacterium]
MPDQGPKEGRRAKISKITRKGVLIIKGLAYKIVSFAKGLARRTAGYIKTIPSKLKGLSSLLAKGRAKAKALVSGYAGLAPRVKKKLAIVVATVLLLSTGAAVGVSAISADQGPEIELIDAYRVNLHGKHIGYVTDKAVVSSIIKQITEESATKFGMEVELETGFDYYRASICPELVTDTDLIVKEIRGNVDIKVNAYAMLVEDEQICILKDEEELGKLLDILKEPFVENSNSEVESVDIVEKVDLEPVTVDFAQVQDAEQVAEEIAEGRETVEEYTVVSGDTLWDIAKKYDMSLDELIDLNSDVDNINNLRLGQTLKLSYPKSVISVATTELITYEVAIPYKTEYTTDSSLYTNQSRTTRNGQNGTTLVEAKVTKVNGIEDSREILKETVTKQPVSRIIAKGTKPIPLTTRSGGGTMVKPAKGRYSSKYGDSRPGGRLHKGIDIAIPNGTGAPIYAAEAGRVIHASWGGSSYGNLIKIDHGSGAETRYAHLSGFAVSNGQTVKKGQLIGYMGNTGNSSGPHLHFEILIGGRNVNPLPYIGR